MSPNKLALYRWAVQHPEAEVAFLKRVFRMGRGAVPLVSPTRRRGTGSKTEDSSLARRANKINAVALGQGMEPTLLKEDFCGSAAVACAWVQSDPECQAMGVDADEPTLKWAWKQAELALFERASDLHLVHADVLKAAGPKVDVVAALNFSAFIYHDRPSLIAYFRHARKSLRLGGVFVMDAYGGPGAWRVSTQTKAVAPEPASGVGPFVYHWEQKACDLATGRVDCRIHFSFESGRTVRNAFRYDWRLWTLPELREAMEAAGFASVEVWCDAFDAKAGSSDGLYRPVDRLATREDFVAYVVGRK